MDVRFPPPLAAGDLIAITAPSSGVADALHPRLDLAIAALKNRGFRVIEGQCLRGEYKNRSAPKALRAKELNEYLFNPDIKAIMPPWGGELAMELLELIDFSALSTVTPKWFTGYSDLTTLQLPLTLISGWATLHGPNLMELGAKTLDSTTQKVWSMLEKPAGDEIEQIASCRYQLTGADWEKDPSAGFNLTEKTRWKRLDGSSEPLQFRGRLIGGCLEIVSRLTATPFGDIGKFCQQHRDDGVVLYLENVEMAPCELTRALLSMRMQGCFSQLSGIVIGRSAAPAVSNPELHLYFDALNSALGSLTVPILYDVDIGHVPPQLPLVNGALATVNFDGETGSLSQRF